MQFVDSYLLVAEKVFVKLPPERLNVLFRFPRVETETTLKLPEPLRV